MLRNPIDHLDVPAKKTSQPRYQLPCSRTDCHSFCEVARGSLPSATTCGLGNKCILVSWASCLRIKFAHGFGIPSDLEFVIFPRQRLQEANHQPTWSVNRGQTNNCGPLCPKYIRFCKSKCHCHRLNPR